MVVAIVLVVVVVVVAEVVAVVVVVVVAAAAAVVAAAKPFAPTELAQTVTVAIFSPRADLCLSGPCKKRETNKISLQLPMTV